MTAFSETFVVSGLEDEVNGRIEIDLYHVGEEAFLQVDDLSADATITAVVCLSATEVRDVAAALIAAADLMDDAS